MHYVDLDEENEVQDCTPERQNSAIEQLAAAMQRLADAKIDRTRSAKQELSTPTAPYIKAPDRLETVVLAGFAFKAFFSIAHKGIGGNGNDSRTVLWLELAYHLSSSSPPSQAP